MWNIMERNIFSLQWPLSHRFHLSFPGSGLSCPCRVIITSGCDVPEMESSNGSNFPCPEISSPGSQVCLRQQTINMLLRVRARRTEWERRSSGNGEFSVLRRPQSHNGNLRLKCSWTVLPFGNSVPLHWRTLLKITHSTSGCPQLWSGAQSVLHRWLIHGYTNTSWDCELAFGNGGSRKWSSTSGVLLRKWGFTVRQLAAVVLVRSAFP